MRARHDRPIGPGGSVCRWVRWSQYMLHAVLLALAFALAWSGAWRRALFVAAAVPVAFLPFSYARLRAQRIVEGLAEGRAGAVVVAVSYAALAQVADLVMLGQILAGRWGLDALFHAPGVTWVGAVWFSAHAMLFLGLASVGLVSLGIRGGRFLARRLRVSTGVPSAEVALGRRQFLAQMGALGVGTPFIVSLSGVKTSYDFRVVEHEIGLPGWPRELDGLRVAHLSDIHVGGLMNRERLLRVADLTNAARPDLVVHTGDFLTHRPGDFDLPLYEALARVRAPYGQWACLGNHDFDDVGRLVRRLGDAGVETLRDRLETLKIAGQAVEIGGLDFIFAGAQRFEFYARRVDRLPSRGAGPRLLLIHDPTAFAGLPEGCGDLVCSGHTHGGHIGVQLGPAQALTVVGLVGIPDQGIFSRGNMRLFVTPCVGFYGYPMRIGIPPEISLLVLRAA